MTDTRHPSALTRHVAGFGLLEGARWYPPHGLVFSDMTNGGVYTLDHDEARPIIEHRRGVGGLVAHADGGFVVSGRNVALRTIGASPTTTVLLETQPDEQFFNDLTADARGRLFVGSVAKNDGGLGTEGTVDRRPGRLYQLDLDGAVRVLADDVKVSNGLGTDPDGDRLYHVDSNRRTIWSFDLDADDPAVTRTSFADTSEYSGVPDGLCVAVDGSVWAAIAGGSVVVVWDAQGRRTHELPVPQPLVTSVCLGGPQLATLFVLTGATDEEPDPLGGAVYSTDVDVRGLPAPYARVRR